MGNMKFMSRLLSAVTIVCKDGRAVESKGKLSPHTLRALGEFLAEVGVTEGEIWIGGDGRIRFSRGIDPRWHQRLRNILLT